MPEQQFRWTNQLESQFELQPLEDNALYMIIEGECKYLQSLGDDAFPVTPATESGVTIYRSFNEIAFLVNNWVKIQDSLEMIFNLLTGSSVKGLEMLAYLRKEKVPADEFANYLYLERKIILINRFTHKKNAPERQSKLDDILNLITDLSKNCHYLIVGNRKFKRIENFPKVVEYAVVLHPSGAVLNSQSEDYHRTWYEFEDSACRHRSASFSLNNFKRLS